jgi:DNA-binding transcriptional MerR regulator
VARRLGVAPATLRTWDRRYGLGPTLHTAGAHRRYSRADIARLEAMRRLVLDGVPPADAARIAADQVPGPGGDRPLPGPSGRLPRLARAADAATGGLAGADEPDPLGEREVEIGPSGGPGGRVLALPGASPEVRGLARAAMALDVGSLRTALERSVDKQGVVVTWEELLRPVLVAVGRRWAATGQGIEVEHLLTETALGVFRSRPVAPEPPNGRPVLLACAPEEMHSLPLSALSAALAERGVGVRLLGGGMPTSGLVAAVRRTGPAAVLVWAQQPVYADPEVLAALPVLRPPVTVLAGGAGWERVPVPDRVAVAGDLETACSLILQAVGR